jgi:hypothetical protein
VNAKIKDTRVQLKLTVSIRYLLKFLQSSAGELLVNDSTTLFSILQYVNYLSNRNTLELTENSDIIKFKGVEGVRKMNISAFHKLADLSTLSQLKDLRLFNCREIQDVSCLRNLYKLEISNCSNIRNVNELGEVHDLSLIACPITSISGLTHNYRLKLSLCPDIQDIKPLGNAIHLSTDLIKENTDLSFLTKTKFLILWKPQISDSLSLSHLFQVHLYDCHELIELHGLTTTPCVSLIRCHSLENIATLGKNKMVHIENCPKVINFICLRNIPRVKVVDCLNFYNGNEVENVQFLSISFSDKLKDISMLENMKELSLNSCHNISSLRNLSNISILYIRNCSKIVSFDGLGKPERIVLGQTDYERLKSSKTPLFSLEDYQMEENTQYTRTFLKKKPLRRDSGSQKFFC